MNDFAHRHASARSLAIGVLLFAGLAVTAWGLASPHRATAQGADVQITELSCNSDPEVVSVTNIGQTPIEMTGWNLQSDPPTSESLPLQQFGSLSAGETLTVESGPKAEGAFVWSRTPVFRDNDSSDFAQLASDAGQVLLKVNCGSVGQQTATPAATPVPAPTALGAADAPAGGGPPGAATAIPVGALIALGSGMLTVGLGMFALPFAGRRRKDDLMAPAEPEQSPAGLLPDPSVPTLPLAGKAPRSARPRTGDSRPLFLLILIGLLLVGALLLTLSSGGHKEK